MARYWYRYNGFGSTNVVGSFNQCFEGPILCPNGTEICCIYVPGGGANPSLISARIRSYFGPAVSAQAPYPLSPQKPYVYVRES